MSPPAPHQGKEATGLPGDIWRQAIMRAVLQPAVVVSGGGTIRFLHGDLRPYFRFPEREDLSFDVASMVTSQIVIARGPPCARVVRAPRAAALHRVSRHIEGAVVTLTATTATTALKAANQRLEFESQRLSRAWDVRARRLLRARRGARRRPATARSGGKFSTSGPPCLRLSAACPPRPRPRRRRTPLV